MSINKIIIAPFDFKLLFAVVILSLLLLSCKSETEKMSETEKIIEVLEKSTDPAVKQAAALRLAETRDKQAINPLVKALNDKDEGVRMNAASALGAIRDTRAVEPLLASLHDSSSSVRLNAVSSLGDLKDKRAIVPLTTLLSNEKDASIRQNIEATIEQIKKGNVTVTSNNSANNGMLAATEVSVDNAKVEEAKRSVEAKKEGGNGLKQLWPFGPDGFICREILPTVQTETGWKFWNNLGGCKGNNK